MKNDPDFEFTIANWRKRKWIDPEVGELAGDISIRVNKWNASENYDSFSKTVRKDIYVSAYPLALWIAYNWWRLNYEPYPESRRLAELSYEWRSAHELAAAGDGFVWPPLRFWFDGRKIIADMKPTTEESPSNAQFRNGGFGVISPKDFEAGLAGFIDVAVTRLKQTGFSETELQILWEDVQAERNDSEQSLYRIVEATLGYDPDEGPEALIDMLADLAEKAGRDSMLDIAAGLSKENIDPGNIRSSVEFIRDIGEKIASNTKLNGSGLSASIAFNGFNPQRFIDARDKPWDAGHRFAQAFRQHITRGNDKIGNDVLAALFNIEPIDVKEPRGDVAPLANFSIGIPTGDSADSVMLYLHSRRELDRRFYLARLLGDRLLNKPGSREWSPATYSKTWRQKFQRAFASEFLCPIGVIEERLQNENESEDELFEGIAQDYDIAAFQVQRHWDANHPSEAEQAYHFNE